jgi:predicted ABC-class ATPase
MQDLQQLRATLHQIDGRGYGDYKKIKGRYAAGCFQLIVDHVQGDPFAAPSRLRAVVPSSEVQLPDWAVRTAARRTTSADFLNRSFRQALLGASAHRGSGKSGELHLLEPGQEVLSRSSLLVAPDGQVESRFSAGLPAQGRRILGQQAAHMLCEDIGRAVRQGLLAQSVDLDALRRHTEVVEDAQALRSQLHEENLVAFVADGSLLPRRSGIDDRPMDTTCAVPFQAPERLRVTLTTPNAGALCGMGIPKGVTLIVGGGYHGKSTLLRALERGVYDHIPEDGRERVVTVGDAVKVRAEDGRSVAGTDISNFIGRLPGGEDTIRFETQNASGSTSQAAAIAEALEVGATCLLLDEDTSATNFMIRDARMQALVADEFEPITPFIDRAQQLYRELGVSTILVVGGSGDYFDVADTVIAMRRYEPHDVTSEAKQIADAHPTSRRREGGQWQPMRSRIPRPDSFDPSRGRKSVDIKTRTEDRVTFGTQEIELSAVEQIVELAQTRAMAEALVWARGRAIDGQRSMEEALNVIMASIATGGLDSIVPYPVGELAEFRIAELAALLNRVRTLVTDAGREGQGEASGAGTGERVVGPPKG